MTFDTLYPAMYISLAPNERQFLVSNQDCALAEFDIQEVLVNKSSNANAEKPRSKPKKNRAVILKPENYYDGDGWHPSAVESLHWFEPDHVCMLMSPQNLKYE